MTDPKAATDDQIADFFETLRQASWVQVGTESTDWPLNVAPHIEARIDQEREARERAEKLLAEAGHWLSFASGAVDGRDSDECDEFIERVDGFLKGDDHE